MRSLIRRHLLVYLLQVYSRRMLDYVSSKELKALVAPTEEHNVVLLSLLKSLDGLGSNGLYLLLCSLELLILLQGQLPLNSKLVPQDLDILLDSIGLVHGRNEVLPQFRILCLQSLYPKPH